LRDTVATGAPSAIASAIWRTSSFVAYSAADIEALVARSRFGHGELRQDGIGFELRLVKPDEQP